jgi:iron(III) transport system permease protein
MQKSPFAIFALGVFAALSALLPLGYLLVRLFAGLEKALAELLRTRTLELLANTLLLTVSVTITAMLLGFIQAWLTTRTNLFGAAFFAVLGTLPLAIPSYVLALAYTSVFPAFNGFFASWITLSLAGAPYVFLAVSAALIRSNVNQEEVARSLGLTSFQVLLRVTWPQVRTAAMASGLLVALYTLSEFGAVSILRFDTFTRAIYNAYRGSFDRTAAAALAVVLVLLTLIVLYFEKRYRTNYTQVEKQSRQLKIQLGSWKFLAGALLLIVAIGSCFVPIAALISWTFSGEGWEVSEILVALGASLGMAVSAGLVIGVFATAVAIWNVRFPSRYATGVELTVWSSHALPALVVALSLVFFGANLTPGLYQTVWLLIFAYLILFLPNALSVITTPIAQVSMAQEQVARSLGLGKLGAIFRLVLPMSRAGIWAGIALASLAILKELPATLLLRPNGVDTLATELWAATETLSYSQAAPYALLLIIIAGVPALVLNGQARKLISEVNVK